jgi:SMP-30/Gluconolactonase/LRE-like region
VRRHAKASSGESPSGPAPRLGFLCMAVLVTLAFAASSAQAEETHFLNKTFGNFALPSGIDVDETTGNVFVADGGSSNSVEIFGPDGGAPIGVSATKIGGFDFGSEPSGVAIDDSSLSPSQGALYVTDVRNSAVKKFSLNGSEEYEQVGALGATPAFSEPLGVAVDSKGNVFVSDYGSASIIVFSPAGAETGRIPASPVLQRPSALAFDSGGNLYVQSYFNGSVDRYEANGAGEIEPTTVPTQIVPEHATGVAVDQSTDTLYVAMSDRVEEYDAAGTLVREFGRGTLAATQRLSVSSTGDVYVVDRGSANVAVFGPLVFVLPATTTEATDLTQTTASLHGTINPEGAELASCAFEYGPTESYGQSAPCAESPAQIGAGTEAKEVHADLTGLTQGQTYHYRLVASRSGAVGRGGDQTFRTFSSPVISDQRVGSAGVSEALLRAEINPEGFTTSYYVEYGLDTGYGQRTEDRGVGAGNSPQGVSVSLSGLQPASTYHWRIVATNSIGVSKGPDSTFYTSGISSGPSICPNAAVRIGASARLANCRAYEMVSPVDKNNTDIVSLINIASNPASLNQSATDGQRLTYTTSQGFGDTKGVPYVSQYLASRTATGWANRAITSPQGLTPIGIGHRIDIEFRYFTDDLCRGVLLHFTDPPLVAGAPSNVPNLYSRQNCGEEGYETLSVNAHTSAPDVQGASVDGRCTVFHSGKLYETCDGQLREVSIMPDGLSSPLGVAGTGAGLATSLREGSVLGAVSHDGTTIYWSPSWGPSTLFVRINADQVASAIVANECTEVEKACTIPVSETVSSATAQFWRASPDGAKALFSIRDGEAPAVDRNLYQFDLESASSTLIASGVTGFVGAAESATRGAFVSKEVLVLGTNAQGKAPTQGEPNLYYFDTAESGADRFQFIGTVSESDAQPNTNAALSPVNLQPFKKTSRISPDGRHLAFMSNAPLTGYDNTDVNNGEANAEVFVYDATASSGEERLKCVSCNPSGQRPAGRNLRVQGHPSDLWGAALLPPYATEFYGSRAISNDGSRVYFNSYEALVPGDTNGKADVYEWEAPGAGSCSEQAGAFSSQNGGCLSLISSGESPTDSEFVDASTDGRDVFFTTSASLVPQDPGLIDIYDAREGGGYPPPSGRPAACEGEACQGPLSPPNDPTPASSAFNGPGNLREASKSRCAKGKARRKGRCVAKKSKQAKKRAHRAANNNRRTAR